MRDTAPGFPGNARNIIFYQDVARQLLENFGRAVGIEGNPTDSKPVNVSIAAALPHNYFKYNPNLSLGETLTHLGDSFSASQH